VNPNAASVITGLPEPDCAPLPNIVRTLIICVVCGGFWLATGSAVFGNLS
jgi:hypothetical protein